jgi:hypothetical protein
MARRRDDDDLKKRLLDDEPAAAPAPAPAPAAQRAKLLEKLGALKADIAQLRSAIEEGDRDTELLYVLSEMEARKIALKKQLAALSGKGKEVGWRLRKAPRRDLYWVVSKEDGKHHSKDPLPLERAKAQMRALYAAKGRMTGGATLDEKMFQSLVRAIPTLDQYTALQKRSPAFASVPYAQFKQERVDAARQRATKAAPGEATPMRCPADQKYDPDKEYDLNDQICMEVPDASVPGGIKLSYGPVRSFLPEGADPDPVESCQVGKNMLGNMPRSECDRLRAEAQAQRLANEPEYQKVFRKINEGLTKIADVGVEAVGSMLPGVGKYVAEAYKTFAPPGSQYYQSGTIAEKAMRRLEGGARPDPPAGANPADVREAEAYVTEVVNQFRDEGGNIADYRRVLEDLGGFSEDIERYMLALFDYLSATVITARSARAYARSGSGAVVKMPQRKREGVKEGGGRDAFLAAARRKAKAAGLAWQTLRRSSKTGKKLQITSPAGKTVHFGAAGMGDHIHYTLAKDPKADEHRRRYRARAEKIRGSWAADKYSPNSLALAVLW